MNPPEGVATCEFVGEDNPDVFTYLGGNVHPDRRFPLRISDIHLSVAFDYRYLKRDVASGGEYAWMVAMGR